MLKQALVFGGTGYVGEAIVSQLLVEGYSVILFSRSGSDAKLELDNVLQAKAAGELAVLEGNASELESPELLHQRIHTELPSFTPSLVVYAIGLIREFPSKGITFDSAHKEWPLGAFQIATLLGARDFVLISAAGVEMAQTGYQKTKLAGEEAIKDLVNSNKNETRALVFRPSTLIGASNKYHFMQVLSMLTLFPIVPVIGDGAFTLSPLFRFDLAQAVVKSLNISTVGDEKSKFRLFVLTGPELITFKSLLKIVKSKSALYIALPVTPLKLLGKIFRYVSFFPVTDEQITMLQQGRTKDWEKAQNDENLGWKAIGIEPTSLSDVLNNY